MSAGLFVTGTDTGVGKTRVACGLLHYYAARGLRVAGYKPVAAGCIETAAGWRHADAEALLAATNLPLDYAMVNPCALPAATAPHLAARVCGMELAVAPLVAGFHALRARADAVVVEGAGGWLVPLNAHETMADLAQALGLPVVLVVGMRLGAINHALLSARAIRDAGLVLRGWVANYPTTAVGIENYVPALSDFLGVGPLAVMPYAAETSDYPIDLRAGL